MPENILLLLLVLVAAVLFCFIPGGITITLVLTSIAYVPLHVGNKIYKKLQDLEQKINTLNFKVGRKD